MQNAKGKELVKVAEVPVRYKLPGENRYVHWQYWNATGLGLYLMAVLTAVKDPETGEEYVFDWACYIGGSAAGAQSERDGVEIVCRQGAKLSRELARAIFPYYSEIEYRP